MKFQKAILALALSLTPNVYGQLGFSLQFSNFGNALTNIADEAGSTASGLSWGILVAEIGSDFSSPLSTALGLSTADGSELAPGFRFFDSGQTTAEIPVGPLAGSVGVITATDPIDASPFTPGIDTGDSFALIWFERGFSAGDTLQAGDNYGILTNSNFLVPADGSSLVPFDENFSDVDPIRSASLVVQSIPEPSSLLLVGLSTFVFLRRRRS